MDALRVSVRAGALVASPMCGGRRACGAVLVVVPAATQAALTGRRKAGRVGRPGIHAGRSVVALNE